MQKLLEDSLVSLQKLEVIQSRLIAGLQQQTALKNETAISDLSNNLNDVNTLIENIQNLQTSVQDAMQSRRRLFPDDITNLQDAINRSKNFFDTLSKDLLSTEKDNPNKSRYIAAGTVVLRELEKLENRSPNNKTTLSFNTQRENIQRNENLKDNSKLFLIALMQEVFNGKETLTSSEFKESLTKVVFEKSNHILGFELNTDSSLDDESYATAEASEHEKSVVPSVFTKKTMAEKLPESEASEVSEDKKEEIDSKESEPEDDDSYYI